MDRSGHTSLRREGRPVTTVRPHPLQGNCELLGNGLDVPRPVMVDFDTFDEFHPDAEAPAA